MKMKTSRNAEFSVNYTAPANGGKEMIISIQSEKKLSMIAADMEGCDVLTITNENYPGAKEVYDGYTVLTSVRRLSTGSVRVTLGREG